MELVVLGAALLLLDILAMRFGVDSRLIGRRDGREWWPEVAKNQPPRRVRLAARMRALATRIDPACAPGALPYPVRHHPSNGVARVLPR